jgi:exopolysaccharide biosynthesis polyprenyl glycosylphosphotransferase
VNRKHTKYFIHYVMDLVGLAAAWLAAIELRLLLNPEFTKQLTRAEARASAPPLVGILLLWTAVWFWIMTYRPRQQRVGENFTGLFESVTLAGTLSVVITFFFRLSGAELSRSLVLFAIPMNCICLVITRYIAVIVFRLIESRWPQPERVAILGAGLEARQIADQVRNCGRPVTVAGVILPDDESSAGFENHVQVLGSASSLAQVINRSRLDRIIIVNGWSSKREIDECGVISKRMGVVLSHTLAVPEGPVRLEFAERFGLPLVNFKPITFSRRQELMKRCFDMVVCALMIILLIPVFLAIAVGIKLGSKGPILYKAARVGRGGRYFTFLKFRSMYVHDEAERKALKNAGSNGHLFKLRNDPRVTPLGRFLRKFSLDELPQLINVLGGEMGLVGPRPLPVEDLDPDGQSREFAVWSEQRSRVLPGITGLWQIRGRSDVPFEQMIELDQEYIREWSLALDLRILLETPLVVLTGRGAY